MSPSGFGRCPAYEPGRSTRFAAALAAVHAAAALAVLFAQLPPALRLAGIAALAASALHAIAVHALRTAPAAIVRIAVRDDGRWTLQRRDGRTVTGQLHGDSFIHRWLVVVGVRDGWRSVFVPIPLDALPPDDHRRLRVLVKWTPHITG
ncbi:MAG: protein YgfX [Gammaproteobacteria bacterium]